jgi:hypothetical protein
MHRLVAALIVVSVVGIAAEPPAETTLVTITGTIKVPAEAKPPRDPTFRLAPRGFLNLTTPIVPVR